MTTSLKVHQDSRDAPMWVAVGIVCAESLVLIVVAGAWVFGIVAAAAALASIPARRASFHLPINSRWFLAWAVACLLKLMFAPHVIPPDEQFIRSQFAHELARFLIGSQLLLLFSKDFLPRRISVFSQLSWAVLILSCDVRLHGSRLAWLQGCLMLALVMNSYFGMRARKAIGSRSGWTRTIVVAMTVAVSLSIGTVMAEAIQRYERQLEWLVTNYLFPAKDQFSTTGFSGRGNLDSVTLWQKFEPREIVLEAVGPEAPGYVTGRLFDTFQTGGQRSEWTTAEPARELQRLFTPPSETASPEFAAPVFGTPSDGAIHWTRHEFWSQGKGRLFFPRGAELFAVHAERLMYTDGSVTALDRTESGELHYVAFAPSPSVRVRLSDEERALFLQQHSRLDPEAARLADQIFAGCTSTDEKCRSVVEYLQSNYQYSRQVSRPREADQISDFLLHTKEGHCEYFATAVVLLLRLGGVPARYATGYVLEEHNPVGGSWVARNSHAHAWAIAYDDQLEEWRIVEATPSEGVPDAGALSWWEARRQAMSLAWRRWLSRTREVGLLPSLGWSTSEHWLIPLVSLLGAVGLTIVIRRWSRSAEFNATSVVATPAPLHKLLKWIDREARRNGYTRRENETLAAFANRIQMDGLEPIAAAYRDYARMRYSQDGQEQLKQLRHQVKQLSTA